MTLAHHNRKLLITSALIALSFGAQALPTGGSVSVGSATISSTANQTTVNQTSQNSVINWTGFNTSKGQVVQINDPNDYSITINRVSGSPTSFDGALKSNGNIVVINPNGMLIGQDGNINTTSFLATTSNITDVNFAAGKYNFTPGGGAAGATVSNAGTITVAAGGLATLVAPNVANSGVINAHADKITLASGDTYTVDLASDGLINLAASKAMTQQSLSNTGTLNAVGGSVVITAAQATNGLDNLINLDGVIEANSLTASNQSGDLEYGANFSGSIGGSFALNAYRNVSVDSNTQIAPVSGKLSVTLDADNVNAGSGNIYLASGTAINSGGGNITLGGGTNPATGYAVGNNAAGTDSIGRLTHADGIFIDGATVNANGGNITMNGTGAPVSSQSGVGAGEGIDALPWFNANSTIALYPKISTTGIGTIAINGTAPSWTGVGVASDTNVGVDIEQATLQSQNGGISISGKSGNNNQVTIGTQLELDTISTAGGAVSISGSTGNASFGNTQGVYLYGGSLSTISGPITVNGTTGEVPGFLNQGVYTGSQQISSTTGNISITGSSTDTDPYETIGVYLDSGTTIASKGTGAGAATITVNGSGTYMGVYGDDMTFSTVDGNVHITGTSPTGTMPVDLVGDQLLSTGKGTYTITQN